MSKATWRNRIVDSGVKPASDFLANPNNWRVHPKHQQQALDDVLEQVGWVQNVIESARTGALIDGHARVTLALRRGDDTPVPYVAVDLTEQEEALILATLDPISALAVADKDVLDALLRQVDTESEALQQLCADLARNAPFGATSTDRDGQGVGSTWDQVASSENARVIIGNIETRLPADVMEMLERCLNDRYEATGAPIYETLEAVIVAGVRAVEAGDS